MLVRAEALKNIPGPIIDITNYWQHYGLRHDPFATLAEEGGYHTLSRWEEHLDLLQYLCHYNNVLVVLTGVNGSGKTTLMHQFISQVGRSMNICRLTADSTLNTNQLIEITANTFNLDYAQENTPEDQLDQHLAMIQESDKICLLVIDDAHLLSSETCRSLLYLISQQTETQKRLHVILSGEPQLQLSLTRLAHNEGHTELLHPVILEPLNLDETEHYLQYRLQNAGLNGEFPLSSLEVARIYKLSEGVPGRINRISRRTLLNALARQHVDASDNFFNLNKAKIYGGSLLLFFAAMTVGILNWMIPDKSYTAKKITRPPMEKVLPALSMKDSPIEKTLTLEKPIEAPIAVAAPAIAMHTPITDNILPIKNEMPLSVVTPMIEKAHSVKISEETLLSKNEMPSEKAPIIEKTLPVKNESPLPKMPAVQKISPVKNGLSLVKTPLVEKTLPVKKELPVVQASVVKASAVASLKSHPHFTVQLLGLSNEQSVQNLIQTVRLNSKINYHHTLLHGKDFYILTYGQFKTAQEASAAIKGLPKILQDQHPFPKKIITTKNNNISDKKVAIR